MKKSPSAQYGNPNLGKRLRKLRLQRGFTQADLARPQYTHAHVSTIESGRRMPSPDALEFFAQKLGVEIEELATGQPTGLTEELRLKAERARADISSGRLETAKAASHDVIKRAREFGIARVEARAHEVLALALEHDGDLDGAFRSYEKTVEVLSDEAPTAWAAAIAGQIRSLDQLDDPHHAIYVGESYLERLKRESMASPGAVLRVRAALVHPYLHTGSVRQASKAAEECQRLIPKVNDPFNLAVAYINVAAVQVDQRHYSDANISFAKAEELFEAMDLVSEAGVAMLSRGVSLAREGKLDEARRVLENASSTLAEAGFLAQCANSEMELARLDRTEGKDEDAADRLGRALDLIGPDAHPDLEAWAHRELGLVLKGKESEKHLQRALEIYERRGRHLETARTQMWIANLRPANDTKGRLQAYEEAAEAIDKIPDI